MKLNEDYTIMPNVDSTEAFKIRILDPDSDFLNWVFQINWMKFDEDEENDTARIAIDYDIIYPSEESDFLKVYSGPDDPRILAVLGPCIENVLELAVEKAALTISDETTVDDADNKEATEK